MKIIEVKQAPVILVEVPDDIINLKVNNARNRLGWFKTSINKTMSRGRVTYAEYIDLPYGCWEIVGILSDVNEEQFAECVPFKNIVSSFPCDCCGYDVDCYRNFIDQTLEDWENRPSVDSCFSSEESFYSLLESEKVYMENPYGVTYKKMLESGMNYKNFLDWHEAQERTIDPERTVVLLKK